MRKRTIPFYLASILLLAAVALISTRTFAASPHQAPHFFLKHTSPTASNLAYHGGPEMTGTANVYAIFWEPTNNVQVNYNSLIQRYFGDVNGSGLYHNNTQYHTSAGKNPSAEHLAASWVDKGSYPRSPLLDSDIQHEVSHAQQANHSYFGSTTIYAAMPYAASFSCNPGSSPNKNDADQTINVTSHEQMEAATDPLLNAWYDSSGNEIGDKCAWKFGTRNASGGDVTWNGHSYIVQKEWDNHKINCVLTGP